MIGRMTVNHCTVQPNQGLHVNLSLLKSPTPDKSFYIILDKFFRVN